MSIVHGYCRFISTFNKFVAMIASFLIFIMVFVISYEVVARYFFGAPTVWALELSTLLLGPYFMLAGPYLLHTAGHVNVDILHGKLSPKNAAIIDAIIYPIIAMICCILIYQSIPIAINSIEASETSFSSWNPSIWPVKALIPVAFFFLLLQSLAEMLLAMSRIRTKAEVTV